MPPLIIRNAVVADHRGTRSGLQDLFIDGELIAAIQPAGTLDTGTADTIDADGGVMTPGFVNAHVHSHELFMRGQVWGMPLEPYILAIAPRIGPKHSLRPEDAYVRTLAAALEMLLGGVTTAVDDVVHYVDEEAYVDAVLQAYEDAGMRAYVSILSEDLGWASSIPHIRPFLSLEQSLLATGDEAPAHAHDRRLQLYQTLIERWSGRSRRVSMMVSPSAPQRVTTGFLVELWRIAEDAGIPFHVHAQETLVQAISGPKIFGHSMIAELNRLGMLTPRTMVAHGVWLDDEDISRLGASGATVVHNPASNLKLGSGVARVHDLAAAGVNVALGCDGYTCNDSQDMLEAMKLASLLSSVASSDPQRWLGPDVALRLATLNGSRALGQRGGIIEVGSAADLVMFDATAPAFLPLHEPVGQVVYGAKPGNVSNVLVGGNVVIRNRRHPAIDPVALRDSIIDASERFHSAARASLAENETLRSAFDSAYAQAVEDLEGSAVFRLVPDGSEWRAVRRGREEVLPPSPRSESPRRR